MTAPEGPGNAPMGGAPAPSYPPPGPTSYPSGPPLPPPGPTGYAPVPPPPARRNRGNLLGLGILVVIIVVIGGGLWLFRDRLSGSVTELAVGDCIDRPPTDSTITEVQHQPCSGPHDGEVFAVLIHPAPDGEAYPVVSGFDDYVEQNCIPAWEAYTARSWATDTELSLNYIHPTLSSWADGGRNITCYTMRVDDAKLNGSVRGVGASALP